MKSETKKAIIKDSRFIRIDSLDELLDDIIGIAFGAFCLGMVLGMFIG
nr:hypothetical protein [uncultured Mogibacterium sp.]DAL90282.1 MAG TPA: Protein of unknown function (DUF1043) [Caudoviricetes sp.]